MKSPQSLKVGLGPDSRESSAPANTDRIWTRNNSLIINVTILSKMGNPFLLSGRVLCWCYSSASTVWSGRVFQITFYLSINPFPLRCDLGNACQDSPWLLLRLVHLCRMQLLAAWAAAAPVPKSNTGWSQVRSQKMARALQRHWILGYVSLKQLLFFNITLEFSFLDLSLPSFSVPFHTFLEILFRTFLSQKCTFSAYWGHNF